MGRVEGRSAAAVPLPRGTHPGESNYSKHHITLSRKIRTLCTLLLNQNGAYIGTKWYIETYCGRLQGCIHMIESPVSDFILLVLMVARWRDTTAVGGSAYNSDMYGHVTLT